MAWRLKFVGYVGLLVARLKVEDIVAFRSLLMIT
jgi:hypothetical protein